ncbi:MAG: retropepsin-like aspartic protease [Sphingomonas sp.]
MVNGKWARAHIDTGATATVIDSGFARRRKLDMISSEVGETKYANSVTVKIGSSTFETGDFTKVQPLNNVNSDPAFKSDIILGYDLLSQVEWQISVTRGGMRISCSGSVTIPRAIPVNTSFEDRRIFLTVYVDGVKLDRTLLDTGSGFDIDLPKATADRLKLAPTTDMATSWIEDDIVTEYEPRRVCRRLFGLSHAAIGRCSIMA